MKKTVIFASRLRSLREAAGFSIPALAAAASMPRQTIHHLENGDRHPSLETARRLCKALGKSLSEFD
jgi:transcriptional regulator with XRE-family HTH domain